MDIGTYAAKQQMLAKIEAKRDWEAWLALGRIKRLETMRSEERKALYEKLGLPAEKMAESRLLDLVAATLNVLKRVPPGLREVIGQALRSAVGALSTDGDMAAATKGVEGILALAQEAAAKGEQTRGMIAQLRSVAKAVAGPAQGVLSAMADNAEALMNRATSLGALDGLTSFLENALEIGRKLMNLEPGSPEYKAAMAELAGLSVELDSVPARKRPLGDVPEAGGPVADLDLDQEALTREQLEAIAHEAEQLTEP